MVKKVFTGIVILLLTTVGILFWQWNVYSEEELYLVDIEEQYILNQTDQDLIVKQIVSNLREGSYAISNPLNVTYTINGKDNHTDLLIVKEDLAAITFEYIIPFDATVESQLLIDWALQLENVQPTKTKLEITVEGNREGSWAAMAEKEGRAKKEYIDYYVFESSGPVFPLFYQKGELGYTAIDHSINLYYEKTDTLDIEQLSSYILNYPTMHHSTVIITNKHKAQSGNGLFILNHSNDLSDLKKELDHLYVDSMFPFENPEEKWQQHILGNLVNDEQLGGQKVEQMVALLKEELLEKEIKSFVDLAIQSTEPLTSESLDETLTAVTSKKTDFFKMNSKEEEQVKALYFYSVKSLVVNGVKLDGRAVYDDAQMLFPLKEVAEKLGFEFSRTERSSVVLSNGVETFRFFPDKNVFILNGTDYAAQTIPIKTINEQIYMPDQWLEDLIKVTVLKDEESIIIAKK